MANGKAFDETGLNIRLAANADAARISELVSRVLAEFGLEFDPGATDSDLADIEGEYLDRGGLFEVIDDADGQILGTYGLWPIDHAAVVDVRRPVLLLEALDGDCFETIGDPGRRNGLPLLGYAVSSIRCTARRSGRRSPPNTAGTPVSRS